MLPSSSLNSAKTYEPTIAWLKVLAGLFLVLGAAGLVSVTLFVSLLGPLMVYALIIGGLAQVVATKPLFNLPGSIPLAMIGVIYLIMVVLAWRFGEERFVVVVRLFLTPVVAVFFFMIAALRIYTASLYRKNRERIGMLGSSIFTLVLGGMLMLWSTDLLITRIAFSLELISHGIMLLFIMRSLRD